MILWVMCENSPVPMFLLENLSKTSLTWKVLQAVSTTSKRGLEIEAQKVFLLWMPWCHWNINSKLYWYDISTSKWNSSYLTLNFITLTKKQYYHLSHTFLQFCHESKSPVPIFLLENFSKTWNEFQAVSKTSKRGLEIKALLVKGTEDCQGIFCFTSASIMSKTCVGLYKKRKWT